MNAPQERHELCGPIRWATALLMVFVAGMLFAGQAVAAKFNRALDVGASAPVWKNLPGIDGKSHSLEDYKDSDVLIVFFTDNYCPATRMYETRLKSLLRDFRDKSVAAVAINISLSPRETLTRMKSHAEKRSWSFDYLRDKTQATGKAYGAIRTPQFIVLDHERKVAYMGGLDNHKDPGKATKHYLRDAVVALLAGKSPSTGESLQRGCKIEYPPASKK